VRGDRFVVAKGGVIAVDARLAGDSTPGAVAHVDESLVSGESAAVDRRVGEKIRGGSVNLGDPLMLVATAPATSSTLANIVTLLERAQRDRPRIAHTADRVASWFVSVILVLAATTALLWWKYDPAQAFPAVLAVLVVSCPCALSLATPAALAAATTRLARSGVLLTRPDAIERLARTDLVVFDKTGTLTGAASGISQVMLLADGMREEVLAIAAALERHSGHPLASAFQAHARADVEASAVREIAGDGMEGNVLGRRWRLGRRGFAQPAAGASVLPLSRGSSGERSTIYLGNGDMLVAAIEVGVAVRPEASEAVARLRDLGLGVRIASGDQAGATADAASALGIRDARSRLSPHDKLWLVRNWRDAGHRVCMVGDGINDGPVLAAADVSCAMGRGSAIAQSAADVLLVNEDLRLVPRAIEVARNAMRVVRQNLGWSLAYNLTAVPLAALGLVSPWIAALGMSLSSLGVVLNARRLATRQVAP
jgi:Cu2+-exporting ATPase